MPPLPALVLAALAALVQPAAAQSPAPKPYPAIAVAWPDDTPKDAAYGAFRAALAKAVAAQDRAAIRRMVLPTFAWLRDFGGGFDKARPAAENFETAVGLAEGDVATLSALLASSRVAREPLLPGAVCGPPTPRYDEAAFDRVLEQTDSDGLDWGVPVRAGIALRARPKADAAVVATLPLALVRGLEWWADGAPPGPAWHRVVAPNGTAGFVASAEFVSLVEEKLCFAKGRDGKWGIAAYVGGGD